MISRFSRLAAIHFTGLALALLPALPLAAGETLRDPTRPVEATAPTTRAAAAVTVLSIDALPATASGPALYDIRAVDAGAPAFFEKLAESTGTNMLMHP